MARRRTSKRKAIALGFAAFATLASNVASADDRTPQGWRYVIEPYFYIPVSIHGDVTVRTRDIPVDIGLSELVKKFDFGAEVHFEAWNGRFGIIADGTYLHIGQSTTLATVPTDWQSHLGIGNVLLGYRPLVAPIGSEGSISAEIDAGGRLALLRVDATIGGDSFSADRAFGRAVFGGRVPIRLSRQWVVGARGYITVPNPDWSALGWVEFDPSPCVAIMLAYKVEHLDWQSDQVGFSATSHGPYIGIGFPFGAGNVY